MNDTEKIAPHPKVPVDDDGPSVHAPVLQVDELSCGYGSKKVLENVSFSVEKGHTIIILGRNGVGKTTLFKTILGFLPPLAGRITICGEDVRGWSRKRFAQSVAYVPQSHDTGFGYTVHQMVLMGRTSSLPGMSAPGREDDEKVSRTLSDLGLSSLEQRDFTYLSGGEQQLVLIARALVQEPHLLMMDEPCASLDLGRWSHLLERIVTLNERGYTIVMTSHDPNHALLLGCSVICIGGDGTLHAGSSDEVIQPDEMLRLYDARTVVGHISTTVSDTVSDTDGHAAADGAPAKPYADHTATDSDPAKSYTGHTATDGTPTEPYIRVCMPLIDGTGKRP